MKYNADDPRITAFLFDELEPDEQAEFEAALAASDELQEVIRETRATIETLQAGLAGGDRLRLSKQQRAAVEAEISAASCDGDPESDTTQPATPAGPAKGRRTRWTLVASICGATAALLLIGTALMMPAFHSARQSARFAAEAPIGAEGADAAPQVLAASPDAGHFQWAYTRGEGEGVAFSPKIETFRSQQSLELQELSQWPQQESADQGTGPGEGGDKYDLIVENDFLRVGDAPLSTFSIDVDTASYAKVRMYLNEYDQLPRPDAVRIEELINYFPYAYEPPTGGDPFASHLAVTTCPWNPAHKLVRIGIKGQEINQDERPASNLVFLLDVSGSMNQPNKLPLLKRGMKMLVDQLSENDRVAIVVYAGAAGMVLDSTTGDQKAQIAGALDRLQAGGSTNGGAGIHLAYQLALDHFVPGGVNRVILCTDGDFNVGTTGTDELVRTVERHAQSGVFLSVLGFGMGNHNDSMLEQISNRGNGNYAFVDTDNEARKVLVEQMAGTLVTIAKDVKIQVEFNPATVAAYRLIGYENRLLADQDFNDDTKDAGEIGAGHTVTALYEIIPAGEPVDDVAPVDDLKYQSRLQPTGAAESDELLTLKLRYKQPDGDTSRLLTFPLEDSNQSFSAADRDFQFAAAVASFGMLLRDSKYKGDATYASVREIATPAAAGDASGYRQEFLELVRKASRLAGEGGGHR